MKPVKRKDIGTNMKRYWDKYETCAKKTLMTLKLFAPHLIFQSLSLTLTSARERKCIIQLLSSFTICIWQNRLVASCLVCQTNKQIQFCIQLLHWKITLHFVSLKIQCSAVSNRPSVHYIHHHWEQSAPRKGELENAMVKKKRYKYERENRKTRKKYKYNYVQIQI